MALGEGGIGRAVALALAREGADLAIVYFNDHRAAEDVRQLVLQEDVRCILLSRNATNEAFCRYAVRKVLSALGRLDILVNDAGNTARTTAAGRISARRRSKTRSGRIC